MQVAAGIAPHVHEGAMSFGTMLPAPLHAIERDVPTEGDKLDLLVMPPIAPVHTTRLEPAAPKLSQRVIDAIARSRWPQATLPQYSVHLHRPRRMCRVGLLQRPSHDTTPSRPSAARRCARWHMWIATGVPPQRGC